MLTQDQILTANAAVAQIPDMTALVSKFYTRLITDYPSVQPLFHTDMDEQTQKLANTLTFAFGKLDDIGSLVAPLKAMGARHKGYGAEPAHYDAVAQSLLKTMADELGSGFDQKTHDTFSAILGLVAQVMQSGADEHSVA